jgi:arsenate reductase
MAEAFARKLGSDCVNVASAGLACGQSVARQTIEVMRERGIEMTDHFPKDYEVGLAEQYDLVVNISGFELPPLQHPQLVEWIVQDPLGEPQQVHRRVRDEIEQHVTKMIEDIRRGRPVASDVAVGQRIAPNQSRRPGLWRRFTRLL